MFLEHGNIDLVELPLINERMSIWIGDVGMFTTIGTMEAYIDLQIPKVFFQNGGNWEAKIQWSFVKHSGIVVSRKWKYKFGRASIN